MSWTIRIGIRIGRKRRDLIDGARTDGAIAVPALLQPLLLPAADSFGVELAASGLRGVDDRGCQVVELVKASSSFELDTDLDG
ncbi:MAG: hypothetical protein N2689_14030 [Verrucomicrobiae bacterium]|nr:hypothetical protein [Verrucomicrobiae bacterium]